MEPLGRMRCCSSRAGRMSGRNKSADPKRASRVLEKILLPGTFSSDGIIGAVLWAHRFAAGRDSAAAEWPPMIGAFAVRAGTNERSIVQAEAIRLLRSERVWTDEWGE